MIPSKIIIHTVIAIPLMVSFGIFDINIGQLFITINVPTIADNSTLPPAPTPTTVGEGIADCNRTRSLYECQQLALLQAQRELARQVQIALEARSTMAHLQLTEDVIRTQTQAVIANQEVLEKGLQTDNRYVYRLRAKVVGF